MMYYETKRMNRDGRSISKISEALNCNRRTVKKYLEMEDQEFESFLNAQSSRGKLLLPYEAFVCDRLQTYRDTPAAQMHDWLKERHQDFPQVNQKTVFNFVKWVQHKHNLPYEPPIGDYMVVQETAYGLQAQVDFGEYNLRCSDGRRVKVYFFTMVLSRFKYVCFSSKPFTSQSAILAHESAFKYMGGIPAEVVYDQDKVFISNENSGELILTSQFKTYVRDRGFKVHMCRKADPESKGKIENAVKYVKQNFLYNRTFYDLDTLNTDGLNWLERTANRLAHGQTKKIPAAEWLIEQPLLNPFEPVVDVELPPLLYAVRKDNTISYKSNLYSLPLRTYKGRGTQVVVAVCSQEGSLIIYQGNKTELCCHTISDKSGIKIINTDHKRDKSEALESLMETVCAISGDQQRMHAFISGIRTDKPRYVRDQLLVIKEALKDHKQQDVEKALAFCLEQGINSANDFKTLLKKFGKESVTQTVVTCALNPLNGAYPLRALVQPSTSRIEDDQRLLTPQLN